MRYKYIIGVDPGKSGGVAIYGVFAKVVGVFKMPQTIEEMDTLFNRYKDNSYCFLEKVHGLPGMGGAAMFTFGEQYGWINTILYKSGIPVEHVTPQRWMKELGLGTKKNLSGTQWKNKLKQRSQQLFPGKKITLAKADALLILQYGLKQLNIR